MSLQDDVKDLAYRLWEEAGRPEGRDMDFWLQAEAQLSSAKTKVAPKPKAEPKSKPAAKVTKKAKS